MNRKIKIAIIYSVIITAVPIVYIIFGKITATEYYCICGHDKMEICLPFIKVWENEKAGERHAGVPVIGKHKHRWNYICETRQDWGGTKWHGDGFGFELHIYVKIENLVKSGDITKEIGDKYKMLLVKDELENDAKDRGKIITEINALETRG